MATARPFSYNTGSTISGTIQIGDLAIGVDPIDYVGGVGGVRWWNGPDEDLGYVIAQPVPDGSQPNPDNVPAYVGFLRSKFLTESSFLQTVNNSFNQSFMSGYDAVTWLNSNGYWTSYPPYPSSLILYWDMQNTASYNGTGGIISDLTMHSNGLLVGSVTYNPGSPKYLLIEGSSTEYVGSLASLDPFLNPSNTGVDISIFMWIYPTTNGVIIVEQGSNTPDFGWYDSQIELVGGTMKFRVWPLGSPYLSSNIPTPLNNWYYVGFTYSPTTITCYINGQNAGSTTVTRQTPFNNGGNAGLYYSLGYPTGTNMGGGGGSTFRFGSLQIYNASITGSQVLQNFNSDKSKYGL